MARTAKLSQLTEVQARAYASRTGTPAPLHDGGGLYLRKRESGAYWYLRMKEPATGAEQWHRMFPDDPAGGYPSKSLKDARTEARRMWGVQSVGLDPRAERERKIQEQAAALAAAELEKKRRVTIRDLFDHWRNLELKSRTSAGRKRTGRKDDGAYVEGQFVRHVFPIIGDMIAKDVTKADILGVIEAQVTKDRQRTAQVLFADLRQMFRFGLDRELIAADPMATMNKARIVGTGTERERNLSEDELRTLVDALPRARMNPRSVIAVWAILATGCRVGELMGATWSDAGADRGALQATADDGEVKLGFVDLQARRWHLPDTKNRREHTIHLSEFAARQFALLHGMRETSAWVFPDTSGTGPVCGKSFAKQLADRQRTDAERMSNRSKAVDALALHGGKWTPHDLRRTASTLMAGLGISGDVIDECLNHQIEGRVRRTYIRDRREADQARAFDSLGARLDELKTGAAPASNIRVLKAA